MIMDISQRDLRSRSKEVMDAVESGKSFTITRGGRPMGLLVPLRKRFVTREQFAASSQSAATPDLAQFRADQDEWMDTTCTGDPYAR